MTRSGVRRAQDGPPWFGLLSGAHGRMVPLGAFIPEDACGDVLRRPSSTFLRTPASRPLPGAPAAFAGAAGAAARRTVFRLALSAPPLFGGGSGLDERDAPTPRTPREPAQAPPPRSASPPRHAMGLQSPHHLSTSTPPTAVPVRPWSVVGSPPLSAMTPPGPVDLHAGMVYC